MTSLHKADRQLRFIIIGAGMAGILAGIKLREAGYDDVVIYEKADRVGGTWRENTYPGLTCDVTSHSYTYSFAPNPDWSREYPDGPEIFAYFDAVARQYRVDALIRFNEEVISCVYDSGQWHLRTKNGGEDTADFLIGATGVLHHPSYPDIKGLDSFKGALFHSARWDHSVPLDGQRIGVIGTGSTGVQIVSALAGRAGSLKQFQRTAQWIRPTGNAIYTDEDKAAFRKNPGLMQAIRNDPAYEANVRFWSKAITDAGSPEMAMVEAMLLQNLEESVKDPELKERLRPNYRAGCKRMVISPDYYEKAQSPNVEIVTEAIETVEAKGIRTADGALHALDVIVLATGFKADQFLRPMNVVGRGGVKLNDIWQQRPTAYLGISLAGFPNLFMLNGPTAPVGNFSLIDVDEHQVAYILQLVALARTGTYREISVTPEAMQDYEARRLEASRNTIFATGCKSWYIGSDGLPSIWPWTYDHFTEEMVKPRLEDFDLVA
jgi:cation diffusion facilitator CzcD-associated flavoprotein CzcO